jgi:outer membrane protein OmpU
MNNFKKIGLTALAGSLVAVSATAGEMSVSGSFNATYVTQNGTATAVGANQIQGANPSTGTGIGNDKDFTVSGSGELDNGWTFSGYTLMTDAIVVSSSALSMTMGSLGTVSVASQSGGNSTKYDVQTPKAYEEVDDGAATSLSANYVGNWLDNNSIIYASPAFELGGITANVHLEYSPEASGTSPNDGGNQASATWSAGKSLGVTLSGHGLTVGVYGADREEDSPTVGVQDAFSGVWYANYSIGPVSIGYSESYYDIGTQGAASATTAAKLVGTATGIFSAETYSVAFNVNDNLSLSYAKAEDTYDAQAAGSESATVVNDTSMDVKSIQAAYSMGAMSVKAYRTETSNIDYDTDAGDLTVNEIALGLAF